MEAWGHTATAFGNILRFVILGDYSANRLKVVLTILGIALGIGIFVAVETSNETIKQSFRYTQGYTEQQADLYVGADQLDFDEQVLAQVQSHPMVAEASPIVIVPAILYWEGREIPFQVYGADLVAASNRAGSYPLELDPKSTGLDLILDPQSIVLNEQFAREHGIGMGRNLTVQSEDRRISLVVRGWMRTPPHIIGGTRYGVMDIAWVQWLFGRLGVLDRIDVSLKPGADRFRVERELNQTLKGRVSAYSSETSGMNLTGLISSFQLNITALSLIALVVGMFLIFNTIIISYIRKRRQIGILRALGVTRRGIFWIFSAESLVYGVVGGAAGVGFGLLLAHFTVRSMATTVNMLYAPVASAGLVLSPRVLLFGFVLGVVASFVSSLIPALEAARTSQAETLKMGSLDVRFRESHHRFLLPGFALLAVSLVFALQKPVWGIPLFGYCATMTIMFGMALLTPSLVRPMSRFLYLVCGRFLGAEGFLAHNNLRRNLSRSCVILCAIMVSLGMMVSFMFMIHSFRTSLSDLIDQVVRFQFFLADRHRLERSTPALLPKRMVSEIQAIPGVSNVEGYLLLDQPYRDRSFVIMGVGLDTFRTYDQIRFLRGDKEEIYREALDDGILISESLAHRHGLDRGDWMEFETPGGKARLRVAGVFYNYQFDRGLAYLDRNAFERFYPTDRFTGIYVYVDDAGQVPRVQARLEQDVAARFGARVITQAGLKQYIMNAFDQTFAITYALQIVAMIVAVLAIVNTLSAAILERRREIGILRCMGFFQRQIRKMVFIEAGMIGALGCALGVATGVLTALVLIFVVNPQSFGWSIRFFVPVGALVWGTFIVLVTTVLAGVFPAARAAHTDLTEAFRYE